MIYFIFYHITLHHHQVCIKTKQKLLKLKKKLNDWCHILRFFYSETLWFHLDLLFGKSSEILSEKFEIFSENTIRRSFQHFFHLIWRKILFLFKRKLLLSLSFLSLSSIPSQFFFVTLKSKTPKFKQIADKNCKQTAEHCK